MGATVLALGFVVFWLGVLSQVADLPTAFNVFPLLGIGVVVLGVVALFTQPGRQRAMAAVGTVLAFLPVALIGYFLWTSDG